MIPNEGVQPEEDQEGGGDDHHLPALHLPNLPPEEDKATEHLVLHLHLPQVGHLVHQDQIIAKNVLNTNKYLKARIQHNEQNKVGLRKKQCARFLLHEVGVEDHGEELLVGDGDHPVQVRVLCSECVCHALHCRELKLLLHLAFLAHSWNFYNSNSL